MVSSATASSSESVFKSSGGRGPQKLQAVALVVFASLICSLFKIGNEFIWDDIFTIVRSDVVHDWRNIPRFFVNHTFVVSSAEAPQSSVDTYRPITLITFVWDACISGRQPFMYHVTNAVFHAACAAGVTLLALKLRLTAVWAAFAGLWFALSPQLAEAHVWINGRSDVFAGFFLIYALLVWRPLEQSRARSVGVFCLALCAFLSKEVALMVIPSLWFWPPSVEAAKTSRQRLLCMGPFALAGAVYLVARTAALSGMRTHGSGSQLTLAISRLPVLWLDGVGQLLAPSRLQLRMLNEEYSGLPGWVSAVCLLVVAALAVAILVRRKSDPFTAWGALAFSGMLAPVAIIATLNWPGFGRYLYLPMIPLAIVGARTGMAAAARVRPPVRRLLFGVGIVYLAVCAGLLVRQTNVLSNEERLYEEVIARAPGQSLGYGYLGMLYVDTDRPADAIPLLVRAYEIAPSGRYLATLGWAFHAVGDVQRSAQVAETGIASGTNLSEFHALAAWSLLELNPAVANEHATQCREYAPISQACSQLEEWIR